MDFTKYIIPNSEYPVPPFAPVNPELSSYRPTKEQIEEYLSKVVPTKEDMDNYSRASMVYQKERHRVSEEQNKLIQQFKLDVIAEFGYTGHKKMVVHNTINSMSAFYETIKKEMNRFRQYQEKFAGIPKLTIIELPEAEKELILVALKEAYNRSRDNEIVAKNTAENRHVYTSVMLATRSINDIVDDGITVVYGSDVIIHQDQVIGYLIKRLGGTIK